jgi:hypothetical protein
MNHSLTALLSASTVCCGNGRDRCEQCNGFEADAELLTGFPFPAEGVHLHPECRRFWLHHNRSELNRFRRVGVPRQGTTCQHCGSTEGEVWWLRDMTAPEDEPARLLHEHCAADAFDAR